MATSAQQEIINALDEHRSIHEGFPGRLPLAPKQILKAGALLAPLPVVMVSTARAHDEAGEAFVDANIATFAWAGIVNSEPPMLSISCRPSRYTHELIQAGGEFVVNLVSEALVSACDFCGVRSGRHVNKFEACKLHPIPAPGLDHSPAIAESPLSLSCRVRHSMPLGSHTLYLAEIVAVSSDTTLIDTKGALHLERADLVAYSHGNYIQTGPQIGFFGYSVARPEILQRRLPITASAAQPDAGKTGGSAMTPKDKTAQKRSTSGQQQRRTKPGRASRR